MNQWETSATQLAGFYFARGSDQNRTRCPHARISTSRPPPAAATFARQPLRPAHKMATKHDRDGEGVEHLLDKAEDIPSGGGIVERGQRLSSSSRLRTEQQSAAEGDALLLAGRTGRSVRRASRASRPSPAAADTESKSTKRLGALNLRPKVQIDCARTPKSGRAALCEDKAECATARRGRSTPAAVVEKIHTRRRPDDSRRGAESATIIRIEYLCRRPRPRKSHSTAARRGDPRFEAESAETVDDSILRS